jgi:hypothetical protein
MMAAEQAVRIQEQLADEIQLALQKHQVRYDTISETLEFLSSLIGGIIGIYSPSMPLETAMENIKDGVQYGMEMGIPKECVENT